ncbi:hypothetical protein ABK040_010325 [Willaertia magna]
MLGNTRNKKVLTQIYKHRSYRNNYLLSLLSEKKNQKRDFCTCHLQQNKFYDEKAILNSIDYNKHDLIKHDHSFRILLLRHCQSVANTNKDIYLQTSDHTIPLTKEGMEQARILGKIIKKYYQKLSDKNHEHMKARIWSSCYERSIETSMIIREEAHEYITDLREHILLGEQQFGLFEGYPLSTLQEKFPIEFAYFQKQVEAEGRFWARAPMGESRFDVAKRIHQFFGTLHRDTDRDPNSYNTIIVTHGVAIRAFLMMWFHLSYKWFEHEKNYNNGVIRIINNNKDEGNLFDGFEPANGEMDLKF